MRDPKLSKLYDTLSSRERFDLFLAAGAREDKKEIAALYRTAPRKTYTMIDAAFTDMVDASETIALRWLWLWDHTYLRFQIAAVSRLNGADPRTRRRGARGKSDAPEHSRCLPACLLVELIAFHTALERFCARVGMSAAALLATWLPPKVTAEITDVLDLARGAADIHAHLCTRGCAPVETIVVAIERALCAHWPGLELGPEPEDGRASSAREDVP